jgi:hypothetical protein
MNALLKAFLLDQKGGTAIEAEPRYFRGQLFADFEEWMAHDAAAKIPLQTTDWGVKDHAKDIARRIQTFLVQSSPDSSNGGQPA